MKGPRLVALAVVFLLVIALAVRDASASAAGVQQGVYKMGKAPSLGDRLPVVGPVFKVYSEGGTRYDFVGEKNRNLDFIVTATAYCSSPRRNGDISVNVFGVEAGTSDRGKVGYGVVVRDQFRLSVPHAKLSGFDAVKACNDGLRTLAAETGDSKASLIARGFSLRHEDVFEVVATASCSGGVVRGHFRKDRAPLDVWVDCRPNAKAEEESRGRPAPRKPVKKAKVVAIAPLVSEVNLEVTPASQISVCPTRIEFAGSITATRAGKVRYRMVTHDGGISPVYTLEFDRAGEKPIRTLHMMVEPPKKPSPSASIAAGDDEPPPPTVRGWRRVEIVEPAKVRPSRRAEYNVICLDKPLQIQAQPVPERTKPRR